MIKLERLDKEFIKRASKTSLFNIRCSDITTPIYKDEIRHIVTKHWFPELDDIENRVFTHSKIMHDLNNSIRVLKCFNPESFEMLYSYNLKGLGPGEVLLYYIATEAILGGGSSAGVDLIIDYLKFEVKAVRPVSNKVMEGKYVNDFKLGGTVDLSGIISDLKALGNVNKYELPASRVNALRDNKYFKKIEEEFRIVAGDYFSKHDVIFMNNSKTNRGEIILMDKVNPDDIFIERMTSGTVKPLIKIL
jgi:hypothetical protein